MSQPYTKLLNSNIQTDQAAALIVCSERVAGELGIDRERWVYPHGAGHAHDHWFVSERADLTSSPAIRLAARAALGAARATIDDIAHLDIYSCFPSAVQIAGRELGIDPWTDAREPHRDRRPDVRRADPATTTSTHAIAAMVERLREDRGALGLTTAVGWYLTKHAVGVFGTSAPAASFTAVSVQAQVDATPRREHADAVAAAATGEACSIVYDRDGAPTVGTATALLDDGRRAVAATGDAALLAAIADEPLAGRTLQLDGSGAFTL